MVSVDNLEDSNPSVIVPAPANSNKIAEIIKLSDRRKATMTERIASATTQLFTVLSAHGVDFTDEQTVTDFRIVSYLIQGMIERMEVGTTERKIFLDMLRSVFCYNEPVSEDETNELFGDLLSRLD